jgi:hypothetical protein
VTAPGSIPRLTVAEECLVAADLARCWVGLTGSQQLPPSEALIDLVQRVQRKSRQVIAERAAASPATLSEAA